MKVTCINCEHVSRRKKGCSWIYQLNLNRYYKILHKICFSIFMKFIRTDNIELRGYFTCHSKCNISHWKIPVSLLTYSICTSLAEYLQSSRGQWKWSISFLLQPHESGDGQFFRGSSFPVLILTGVKYHCRGKTMPPSELMEETLRQLNSMDLDCSSSVFSLRFNLLLLKPSSFISALFLHSFLTLVFLCSKRLWFWKLRRANF